MRDIQISQFFSSCWPFLANSKKRKAIFLIISVVLLSMLCTCIATTTNTNTKNNFEKEKRKFGVVDSILANVQTPSFPCLKEDSSCLEEEFVNLFWRVPMFISFVEKKEINLGLNGFYWPTEHFVVTDIFGASRFGVRHKGVDIRVEDKSTWEMSNIFSAESGEIVRAGRSGYYGLCVDIKHIDDSGQEFFTRYAHLSKIYVRKGRIVFKGERIGRGGKTGRSRGPHLHFEVFVTDSIGEKTEYDPLAFFPDFKFSYLKSERRNELRKNSVDDIKDTVLSNAMLEAMVMAIANDSSVSEL